MYYHCDRTRQLNERFGDMQNRIQVPAVRAVVAAPQMHPLTYPFAHCAALFGWINPSLPPCRPSCPPCQDMESSIACQLTARLAEFAPEVAAASEAVAELDCLLALALAARNLNLCRPEVRTCFGDMFC